MSKLATGAVTNQEVELLLSDNICTRTWWLNWVYKCLIPDCYQNVLTFVQVSPSTTCYTMFSCL